MKLQREKYLLCQIVTSAYYGSEKIIPENLGILLA